ncbi:MAG: hypothetical protein ACREJ3_13165, partial [Polyangiaceae bacterium]
MDRYSPDDVRAYAEDVGLNTPPSPLDVPGLGTANELSSITQEVVPSSGPLPFSAIPFTVVHADPGFEVDSEADMDVDMVLAMAPQANIIVYESPNDDPDAVLAQIADEDKAQVITDSWHWGENGSTNAERMDIWNIAAQFAAQSQTYVASAGDHGSFVADDPYVSGVGGPQPQPDEPIIDSPYIT